MAELTETQKDALRRLKFFANTATCSNCGKGPFMVKGPLGGSNECPGCGNPVDPSDVKKRGLEIPGEAFIEWWCGRISYCAFCSSINPGNVSNCTQCGADLEEAVRPDLSKMSAEMRRVLAEAGIAIDAPVPQPEWRRDVEALSSPKAVASVPVVLPMQVPAEHTYVAAESRKSPLRIPDMFAWFKPWMLLPVVAVIGLIWLIVWASGSQNVDLQVIGFEYRIERGYLMPGVAYGTCYVTESDDDCPAVMTPIATNEYMARDDGTVVVATRMATEVAYDTMYDHSNSHIEVELEVSDMENSTIVLVGTATPIPYEVTVIVETSVDVEATLTPYAVNEVSYAEDVIFQEIASYGVQQGRPEVISTPDIPFGGIPDPSRDKDVFWVVFQDTATGKTYFLFVNKTEWYGYFSPGQLFEQAEVGNTGDIRDLNPAVEGDPSD